MARTPEARAAALARRQAIRRQGQAPPRAPIVTPLRTVMPPRAPLLHLLGPSIGASPAGAIGTRMLDIVIDALKRKLN